MGLRDCLILRNMVSKFGNFKEVGTFKDKTQIILCHTSRGVKDYLTSLNFRYNGKYDRIPNYVIKKNGDVLELIGNDGYTNYHNDLTVNQKSITVVLENLGWLDKKPLTNYYINWIGDIYNGVVYEKRWRDFFHWDPYPNEQVNSLVDLCVNLCDSVGINKKCSEHNTKIDGIKRFKGIVTRSNYDSRFTDLSPAFNFEKLINKL